jgi:hypothetical protein
MSRYRVPSAGVSPIRARASFGLGHIGPHMIAALAIVAIVAALLALLR